MRIADTEGAALATEIDAPNLVPNGERDAPHEPRWRAPSRPAKAAPRGGRLLHWVALVTAWFVVLTTVALGLVLYWQRQQVKAWLGARPAAGWQRVVAPSPPKISDRLGPGQQAADAASAQRASLYEEDPGEREGKRHDGTVIWRTETLSPERQPPELAIRAELEIPEWHLRMTLLLHRNTDKALPASHTLEIAFQPPGNFGEISSIPALLMKSAELSDGSRLAGVTARVTSGLFLIGLSAADGQIQRNLQMLKELTWFDIPIVYENGRRAILAIEKGAPGERAFQEAFMAWSAAPANPARQ